MTGSKWVPSDRYTVKLEGARKAGYQTVSLTLVRDAHYVAHIQKWCDDIHRRTTDKVLDSLAVPPEDFSIELRLIGKNATLGALETNTTTPAEIGVLGIVTAKTEALAAEICKMLNPYLLHHSLSEEEEMPTFAFPFSPAEIQRGAIYEFCLNHVMQLDDPMQAFRLEVIEVGP